MMTSNNPKANIINNKNYNNDYLLVNPTIKPYKILGSEEIEFTRLRTTTGVGENALANGKEGQKKRRKIKIEMNASVPQIDVCLE